MSLVGDGASSSNHIVTNGIELDYDYGPKMRSHPQPDDYVYIGSL